jgi:ketosteroid isomerase-like protein
MKAKRLVFTGAVVFLLVGPVNAKIALAFDDDDRAVRAAAEQSYFALNAMFTGDLVPMQKVWSHADDVTYMGPGGGFRIGWAEVLADRKAQTAMKLGGDAKPGEMRITAGRDLAVVSNYETGENAGPGGKSRKVDIRATNRFRKENGKWKMIGHYTDMLPRCARSLHNKHQPKNTEGHACRLRERGGRVQNHGTGQVHAR